MSRHREIVNAVRDVATRVGASVTIGAPITTLHAYSIAHKAYHKA
jgi:hypothetical protein